MSHLTGHADWDRPPASADCSAAELFGLLWEALTEVIGPTATAALMQRGIARASARGADLAGLVIRREKFHHAFSVPAGWKTADPAAVAALRSLAAELVPLLEELTGSIVVRQLQRVPELARCGVIAEDAWR